MEERAVEAGGWIGVQMDARRAEELLIHLADIVDLPPFDQSERLLLSRTLAVTSLHYAASVRALCANHLAHGAAVVLRSQFEGLVRSVWVYHFNEKSLPRARASQAAFPIIVRTQGLSLG